MSFYSNVEDVLSDLHANGLKQMLFYYGIEVDVYVPEKGSVYSKVHGTRAGGELTKLKSIDVILQSDDFFPTNLSYGGGFESGFMYCKEDKLVGNTIAVKHAQDGKTRKYKIAEKEAIGNTKEVFFRYSLSAQGD